MTEFSFLGELLYIKLYIKIRKQILNMIEYISILKNELYHIYNVFYYTYYNFIYINVLNYYYILLYYIIIIYTIKYSYIQFNTNHFFIHTHIHYINIYISIFFQQNNSEGFFVCWAPACPAAANWFYIWRRIQIMESVLKCSIKGSYFY